MPKVEYLAMHAKPHHMVAMKMWCRCSWIEVPTSTPRVELLATLSRAQRREVEEVWCRFC